MVKQKTDDIDQANNLVAEKILSARPCLVDVKPAIDIVPEMKTDTILHPGPPIDWKRMCKPMKGAVIGALLYEGLAKSPEKAVKIIKKGEISLSPTHHHSAVGGMSNVISASMPVFVVKNNERFAYSVVREGTGKALRYGVFSKDVIAKLKWVEKTLGPSIKNALAESGPIELRNIIAGALHMGDECHSRCIATTLLFERILTQNLLKADIDQKIISQIVSFFEQDQNFGLCLVMGAAKATMDAAHGVKNSTIVTAMSRNGVDFGIRVSGLGDKWFTAPSPSIDGVYFPGFGPKDANPDIGDSAITETLGLGGFVMAAAPTILQVSKHVDVIDQGETVAITDNVLKSAINYSKKMYKITLGKNRFFTIPILNFLGAPIGIDIRKVVKTGITPYIETAIAHKEGYGMIGAGLAKAPINCFAKALNAFRDEL